MCMIDTHYEHPVDERIELYQLKQKNFFVFDPFENVPKNYYRKDGQMFNIPLELSDMDFILFNGNLKGVFTDKDPKQLFLAQDPSGSPVRNICEIKRGDLVVLNPPLMLVTQRGILEKFFTKELIFDFSMS